MVLLDVMVNNKTDRLWFWGRCSRSSRGAPQGLIPPLHIRPLPHDLCHGQDSSSWLPALSLLIQSLRCAFETWFRKIANAPGQLSQRATTTEPECPRACDLHQEKHKIEKPVHCHNRVAPGRCKNKNKIKFSQRNQ